VADLQPQDKAASPSQGSTNLERCLACKYSKDRDPDKGVLTCTRHNMLINADVDEIPDDCPDFEPEPQLGHDSHTEDSPRQEQT